MEILVDLWNREREYGRRPTDRKKMAVHVRKREASCLPIIRYCRAFSEYTYVECQLETGRTPSIHYI